MSAARAKAAPTVETATAAAKPALNLSALNFGSIGVADSRKPITSKDVVRPTRDIVAEVHAAVRGAIWRAALETIASMHGESVEAKGAKWEVNDDETARAIRVNYNLLQPDYYTDKRVRKMDLATSQEVWTQICEQLGKDAPTFTDSDDSKDDDKE